VPTPRIFTIDVGARPVVAIEAASYTEATSICNASWFVSELTRQWSQGQPIFNGHARISARNARPSEISHYWKMANLVDRTEGGFAMAFLIELDNP
jgi:hypothetical protein